MIAGSRLQAHKHLAGARSDPISLVAAEIHHGLGAAGAHAGRHGSLYSRSVPTQHKPQNQVKSVIYVFVRCMKWIKVHAASGSNGLKIKPRIDLINL
ncbi:hypothetical protein [Bradyrhizobium sp. Ghvi]|uniref:hypothetical protein n=1 Tax=Bradyrhizobium sp. Ghvi TaxID=1855319 RepID=UPI001177A1E3|nr:hypothetical protein [Bradyrhizobium sp. Ghvi]